MYTYKYLNLVDGRKLSYAEFGNPEGVPVFYFHGSPSSCLECLLIGDKTFNELNLRVIAPNRPGIGESSFQKERKFTHWPGDMIALADFLKIKKFAVLGNSGGAAYVIACASQIPNRITAAAVVSGAWQMNLPIVKKHLRIPLSLFWAIAARLPFLLPLILNAMKTSANEKEEVIIEQFRKTMTPEDYQAVIQYDRAKNLAAAMNEAVLNKKAAAFDVGLYVRDWEIDFTSIAMPISFFHGENDKNVPVEIVKEMVLLIPGSSLFTFKNEAHFSVFCNQFNAIAKSLVI